VRAALLDPPDFDPRKLEVIQLGSDVAEGTRVPSSSSSSGSRYNGDSRNSNNGSDGRNAGDSAFRRRYTLTHNDLTGFLTLSVGETYNSEQLSGLYTRFLRDEVLAELVPVDTSAGRTDGGAQYELRVYCHVSGEAMWLAPAGLRSFIFLREMTLVLETIAYADRELIASDPLLREAVVVVHLISDVESLNREIAWGLLGDKRTWKKRRSKRNLVEIMFSTDLDEDDYDGDVMFDNVSTGAAAEFVALNSKE
jgi:hypothetical protein